MLGQVQYFLFYAIILLSKIKLTLHVRLSLHYESFHCFHSIKCIFNTFLYNTEGSHISLQSILVANIMVKNDLRLNMSVFYYKQTLKELHSSTFLTTKAESLTTLRCWQRTEHMSSSMNGNNLIHSWLHSLPMEKWTWQSINNFHLLVYLVFHSEFLSGEGKCAGNFLICSLVLLRMQLLDWHSAWLQTEMVIYVHVSSVCKCDP